MKSRIVLTVVLLLLVYPALAKNPPKPKAGDPAPPIWDTRGIEEVHLSPALHDGPPHKPEQKAGMSGALFPAPKPPKATTTTSPAPSFLTTPHLGRVGTTAVPYFIESLYTANASSDPDTANEAALVTINRGGVDYTVLSYQQAPAGGYYSVRAASTTNLTSASATFNRRRRSSPRATPTASTRPLPRIRTPTAFAPARST